MTRSSQPRGDYLASFCFVDEGDVSAELTRLSALAAELEARYQYFELVYVVAERHRAQIENTAALLSNIRNLRILLVNNDMNFYRRRVVAASEAIGDVVVLSAISELAALDVIALADQAFESGETIMARRAHPATFIPLWHWVMAAVSPYKVNARDLRTVSLPRTHLNEMLGRPTLVIDLRFEAKQSFRRFQRVLVSAKGLPFRGPSLGERVELLGELVTVSAPRLLKTYAAFSFMTAGLAFAYTLYAITLFLIGTPLAPGWFTTALAQGGSVTFLAVGFCLISLGLADVVDRLTGRTRNAIVDEIANINFFKDKTDLNVEVLAQPHTVKDQSAR